MGRRAAHWHSLLSCGLRPHPETGQTVMVFFPWAIQCRCADPVQRTITETEQYATREDALARAHESRAEMMHWLMRPVEQRVTPVAH